MIIENQAMVTDAVIEAVNRTEDPRLREILLALVRHLHGFVREVRPLMDGHCRKGAARERAAGIQLVRPTCFGRGARTYHGMLNINLKSAVNILRAVIPRMRQASN